MKRIQSFDGPTEAPKLKKAKLTPEGSPANEEEGWTKVEKRKQKKQKNKEVKSDMAQPRFMYANSEIVKRNHAIGIEEVRDLVLHIIADAPPPNWLRIDNTHLIQKVVTVLVPGLTPELLGLPPIPTSPTVNPNVPISIPLPSKTAPLDMPSIPFIAKTFSHAVPTRAPGDQNRMHSVLSAFFQGPVSSEERKKRATQRVLSENVKDVPTNHLLTLEQMIENDYPVPSYMADVFQKPEGWVETPEPAKQPADSTKKATIYAIDCEMCLTENGKELTRVCIIDYYSGIVVYDQLVKPSKPIIDYLTRWSGITAEALGPVTTTLAQVQAHILRLLSPPAPNPFSTTSKPNSPPPPTPILLGHSLESDLKALKICHPLCIDTALMYHHPRGRPLKPGLAWLTKKWCGREIQARGEGGHDPEEDARACVELMQRKIEGGPGFGEFKVDFESIFERMGRATRRAAGPGGGTVKSAVVDYGNPGVMHGSKAQTAVSCTTDEEVLAGLLDVIPAHHFAFGRFMAMADLLGWTTPKTSQDAPPPTPTPAPSAEALTSTLSKLNDHLAALHAALPPRTALVIFTGHSDPRRMAALNTRKMAFENALRAGQTPDALAPEARWTAEDGRELETALELAKRGLLFLGVKQ